MSGRKMGALESVIEENEQQLEIQRAKEREVNCNRVSVEYTLLYADATPMTENANCECIPLIKYLI